MKPEIISGTREYSLGRWNTTGGLAAVLSFPAVLAIGVGIAAGLNAPPTASEPSKASAKAESPLPAMFRDWPANRNPDIVVLLSGEQHGYLQRCGCSHPQYGGLDRRWNLIQNLKRRGWTVVGADLGDIIEPSSPHPTHRTPQTLLRYQTSMKGLRLMNYLAVGVGLHETEMPLLQSLSEYALNEPAPRIISANLIGKDINFADLVGSWVVGPEKGPVKVGLVSIVGPTVRRKVPNQDPPAQFAETIATLDQALKQMQQQQPELLILLYQGTNAEARACAAHYPQFHAILCRSDNSEPPDRPERAGQTLIINVGHKGRYVGVLGVYRSGDPPRRFDLHYQLVMLGPEWETPADQPNPILDLLEAYTRELKDGNYLARYPRRKHPLQVEFPKAEYVGSDACMSCHRHAYKVWAAHGHAKAHETLVHATKPSLRQFDGECIVCHTVGFGFQTGFEDEQKSAHLLGVGCENCHGPGSLHAELGRKTPQRMLDLMNPHRHNPNETEEQRTARVLRIDLECQKCHDSDNDVHWSFAKKWPEVIHHTPK